MIPKFRGKSTADENNGEWVYGNLIVDGRQASIVNGIIESTEQYISIGAWCPVDAETVGQSTGLKDKNGVEIFEGDLLSWDGEMPHIVKFGQWIYEEDFGYKIKNIGFYLDSSYDNTEWFQAMDYENIPIEFEIIGNIYENQELVEGNA